MDEFRPCLMDGVPELSKLLALELARVTRGGPDYFGAPMARADGAFDVSLGYIGVHSTGSEGGVRVNFRWPYAVGLGRRCYGQQNADSDAKCIDQDAHPHLVVSLVLMRI